MKGDKDDYHSFNSFCLYSGGIWYMLKIHSFYGQNICSALNRSLSKWDRTKRLPPVLSNIQISNCVYYVRRMGGAVWILQAKPLFLKMIRSHPIHGRDSKECTV